MTNNKYYCYKTFDSVSPDGFYIRQKTSINKPVMTFSQFNNTLEIKFDMYLEGDFSIPNNLLNLQINSNIGQFKDIGLKLVKDYITFKHYTTSFLINLSTTTNFSKQCFLEEMYFNISLDVNKDVFNNSNLNKEFNNFYTDLLKINYKDNILFNNYFPINKLSEYYISSKYKNDYQTTTTPLPSDFFTWANKQMSVAPDYWFNLAGTFTGLSYQPINALYRSNATASHLIANAFKTVNVSISYNVANQTKTLSLDLVGSQFNQQAKNTLFLGVKTLYSYERQELYQTKDTNGVNGIYFPVPVTGNIAIKIIDKNKTYTDNIEFSFKNDFYSNSNTAVNFEVGSFTQTTGQWMEIMYA